MPDILSKDKRPKRHFIEKSQYRIRRNKETSKYLIQHNIERQKIENAVKSLRQNIEITFRVRQIIDIVKLTNNLCSTQLLANIFFSLIGLPGYFGVMGVHLGLFSQ